MRCTELRGRPIRTMFRSQIALLVILLGGVPASAQVAITPSTAPEVSSGQTIAFKASVLEGGGVTWSCPGCAGSINSRTGVYTAPSSIHSNQSWGGYQVLPNDHIYNQRIDSLPVNSNSGVWIAGAGAVPFSIGNEPSFPINYVNSSTPKAGEIFEYSSMNNGAFQIPPLSVRRVECGTLIQESCDRHMLAIDTTNGTFQEIYNLARPGTISGCPACTAVSGVRYPNITYDLPKPYGGAVDAAGLYVMPLTLRLQEMEQAVATAGTIKHALRMTLQNEYIQFNKFIWPATATTSAGKGVVPYGARFRLKSGFNISGFSPIAQIILTQLKQYGLILADGGTGWASQIEYTRWPDSYLAAFSEIYRARILPSNFEAVDESVLELSAASGATTKSETVVATGIVNPSHAAKQQAVLTGVTLTLPHDYFYIQAGTSPQQMVAFVNGSSNKGITWKMDPAVGSLASGGLYTPPMTTASTVVTTVTATSNADSSVFATMSLSVLPPGPIRIILGQNASYTDSHGNVWQGRTLDDRALQHSPNIGSWPRTPDIQLYEAPDFGDNDMRFDITVPNGTYNVRGLFAETRNIGAGNRLMDIEAQGAVVRPNVDIQSAAGVGFLPVDITVPATVTNGTLSYVLRRRKGDFTMISSIEIVPLSVSGTGTAAPPTNVKAVEAK
jgi:hypothetical protein